MSSASVDYSKKRSRSPNSHHHRSEDVKRHRSRSPHRKPHHHHHHHHHHHRRRHEPRNVPTSLPLNAQPLHKSQFQHYEGLFARYLDVQKLINIDDLSETEIRGRWKSFVGKWNRGELAEGWYDAEARWRAEDRWKHRRVENEELRVGQVMGLDPPILSPEMQLQSQAQSQHDERREGEEEEEEEEDDSDDGYGPALPNREKGVLGAAIPNLQDLQHRNELVEEAHLHDRANLLYERKLDRNLQKERVEELVPRADPGSRERQMEKKADKTFTLHQFREAKDGGDVEVGEQELMGGGDGEQEFQREVKQRQRAKSEREIRKEEALRARMAEREERMRGVRMKEEKTMEMLRNIAKTRFG